MPSPRTQIRYLSFYLQGREDAADSLEGDDETEYDAHAIASMITSVDAIHDTCRKVVTDDLSNEPREWSGKAEDLAADLDDHGNAFKAWTRGYIDELACALEAEVCNELVDLAEEDTAVETPIAKRTGKVFSGVTRKPNPVGDRPSYGAYFEDGIRDCENTFSTDDFDPELRAAVEAFRKHRQDISKLAAQAVKDYWRENETESKAQWHSQNDETVRDDGLKPDRAYELWADGWRAQAQKYIAIEIVKRAED